MYTVFRARLFSIQITWFSPHTHSRQQVRDSHSGKLKLALMIMIWNTWYQCCWSIFGSRETAGQYMKHPFSVCKISVLTGLYDWEINDSTYRPINLIDGHWCCPLLGGVLLRSPSISVFSEVRQTSRHCCSIPPPSFGCRSKCQSNVCPTLKHINFIFHIIFTYANSEQFALTITLTTTTIKDI